VGLTDTAKSGFKVIGLSELPINNKKSRAIFFLEPTRDSNKYALLDFCILSF
jgi:hypothetical protein